MKIDDRNLASRLVAGAVILALLVYGQPILVPLVFALLVWAVLNAILEFLERFLPVWLAWLTTFVLIAAALYFVALVLATESAAVAGQAPVYIQKLDHLWNTEVPFRRFVPGLDFQTLVKDTNIGSMLGQAAASVGNALITLGLIAIFVGFLLAEQRYLPTKLARLQSGFAAEAQAEVFHTIGRQVRSYLGVCTLLSVVMGAACYALLTILHVDFAGFWALMMFLLTYIPTVGGAGVVLPALMALAQYGSLGPALIILVVLGFIHFVLTNVVEAILLGRSLNLSPFAIILSLAFWGLVWGIGGLFLAVPLTGAIAIGCRHLEGMSWFADLVAGPEPPRGLQVARSDEDEQA